MSSSWPRCFSSLTWYRTHFDIHIIFMNTPHPPSPRFLSPPPPPSHIHRFPSLPVITSSTQAVLLNRIYRIRTIPCVSPSLLCPLTNTSNSSPLIHTHTHSAEEERVQVSVMNLGWWRRGACSAEWEGEIIWEERSGMSHGNRSGGGERPIDSIEWDGKMRIWRIQIKNKSTDGYLRAKRFHSNWDISSLKRHSNFSC